MKGSLDLENLMRPVDEDVNELVILLFSLYFNLQSNFAFGLISPQVVQP